MDDDQARALAQAEYDRLHRALNNGPGRRMVDDTLAGRRLSKADEAQAARYQGVMAALVQAHGPMHRPL